MTTRTAARALADATAGLTAGRDVTDVLDKLVRDSAAVLSAQAVGLLVLSRDGDLELLSATSHQVAELEAFQIQHDTGPCVDAIRDGAATSHAGRGEILARWPQIGPAIIGAGYQAVHAYPLRWHGRILGAMNAFHTSAVPQDGDTSLVGQALADMAAVVIVQTAELTAEQVAERVQQALLARTAIEQAKGVLAYTRDLDMAAAYDALCDLASRGGASLGVTAAGVIARARRQD